MYVCTSVSVMVFVCIYALLTVLISFLFYNFDTPWLYKTHIGNMCPNKNVIKQLDMEQGIEQP